MSIRAESLVDDHLTPDAAELLRSIRSAGFPGWSAMKIADARAAIMQMKAFAGAQEPVALVEPVEIPRPGDSALHAQLYRPQSEEPLPTMVYMHGGGWVIGNHTSVDELVRTLVNRSGCAVLSIDYRLAPEHKYPAALNDVLRAASWITENSYRWTLDCNLLALGGDSSGANLSAAAALYFRDHGGPKLNYQLLVYPALDSRYETTSHREFGDGAASALSTADVRWFHNHYVNAPRELELPYVSPLRAESLVALPPTLLICAGVDPLLDDSTEYARRLKEAGVPVEMRVYSGMFHGFWRMAGVLAEAREALQFAGERMRHAMRSVPYSEEGTLRSSASESSSGVPEA